MTKYVIRSMTTTDAGWGKHAQPITPYHIYLRAPEKRTSAYWSGKHEAQLFDTIEDAQAEIARCGLSKAPYYGPEVSPLDDKALPTYWDNQNAYYAARKVC